MPATGCHAFLPQTGLAFTARPLKRFLQRQLETALSRKLLAGDITDHSRVTVDFKKGELVFETKTLSR